MSSQLQHKSFTTTSLNMSSRRLVNRGRANQDSSPVQRSRHRDSEATQEPTPLPPYEPPTCALTPSAKRALENLCVNHDYSKYKKHLDGAIKTITNSIGDSNERLRLRKEQLAKIASRRREDDEDGKEALKTKEAVVRGMENKVTSLTAKADKALRDLIDYGDELAMKETMMKEVNGNIAAAPDPRPVARRRRRQGSNDGENAENEELDVEEDSEPEVEGSIVSAVESLKKAQKEYAAKYASKSMRDRYNPFINSQLDVLMLIQIRYQRVQKLQKDCSYLPSRRRCSGSRPTNLVSRR